MDPDDKEGVSKIEFINKMKNYLEFDIFFSYTYFQPQKA
jgi:hypothetical protein